MIYLSPDIVVQIHARILEAEPHGINTSPGVLNPGLLESILLRMREKVYGEEVLLDVFTKAAYLLKSVNDFHPFVDTATSERVSFRLPISCFSTGFGWRRKPRTSSK